MDAYRVVIADDNALFRRSLRAVLAEEGSLEVVGEASNGLELLRLVDTLSLNKSVPHLAVVDISMPVCSGIEAARKLKLSYPDMKILILTMHDDKEFFRLAMSAGVDGYMLKTPTASELFSAIELIRQGEIHVPEDFRDF